MVDTIEKYDFVVIGGGIAGASVAAHLAAEGRLRLLEREEQPGYHSTGRSAALFSEAYGTDVVRALTRASRRAFYAPESGFCGIPLVRPRSVMVLAHEGQAEALEYFIAATAPVERLERLTASEAAAICPIVRPEQLIGAAIGRHTADIEVHELHQAYLRLLKKRGGSIRTSAEVTQLTHDSSGWRIVTTAGTMWATTIVNAAGAWAAQIGALAGALNVGLRPLKRTACLVPAPEGFAIDAWPMVLNVAEEFYLKPDAGMLLLSPADEAESSPCDAQADELDIAIAIDRVEQATTLNVRRVARRWAGLRSFVADSSPVVGYDPIAPGFFWVAALGGYGIQTAPALGRIAARLAARREVETDILEHGIELAAISPGRSYRVPSDGHQIGVARG